jgi:filamentous hemagglutinin
VEPETLPALAAEVGEVAEGATVVEDVLAESGIRLSQKGLDLVGNHLEQFGDYAPNTAMMQRLNDAFSAGQKVTGADANFYLHEASEATMMGRGFSYDAAHAAAIEKYGVSPFSLYHPEVIQANPLMFNNAWRNYWNLPPKP